MSSKQYQGHTLLALSLLGGVVIVGAAVKAVPTVEDALHRGVERLASTLDHKTQPPPTLPFVVEFDDHGDLAGSTLQRLVEEANRNGGGDLHVANAKAVARCETSLGVLAELDGRATRAHLGIGLGPETPLDRDQVFLRAYLHDAVSRRVITVERLKDRLAVVVRGASSLVAAVSAVAVFLEMEVVCRFDQATKAGCASWGASEVLRASMELGSQVERDVTLYRLRGSSEASRRLFEVVAAVVRSRTTSENHQANGT